MRVLWFLVAFPTALGATPASGDEAPAGKAPAAEAPDAAPAAADAPASADVTDASDADDEPGARTSSFGAGFDWFFDSGQQNTRQVNMGGGNLSEGHNDISNDGVILGGGVALDFWFMTEVASRLSLGGSLRFLGTQGYELDDGQDDPLNLGPVIDLGQMIEVGPRLQYLLPITSDFGIAFGGELALALVFPGRDLGRHIDSLDGAGFNTTGLPRLGFLFGPQVGPRYVVNDWLALRVDLGYLWEWLFLLNSSAEVGGLRGEEVWDTDWTRVRIHLGAELMF